MCAMQPDNVTRSAAEQGLGSDEQPFLAKPSGSHLDPGVAALSLQCQAERRGDDARDQQHNHRDVLHGRQQTSSENIISKER
jgi:hypothetical protein